MLAIQLEKTRLKSTTFVEILPSLAQSGVHLGKEDVVIARCYHSILEESSRKASQILRQRSGTVWGSK